MARPATRGRLAAALALPMLVLPAVVGPVPARAQSDSQPQAQSQTKAPVLSLPRSATATSHKVKATDSLRLATGRFADGGLPVREIAGTVTTDTWRIPGGLTTGQTLEPLRRQLVAAGYDILFDCTTQDCGGFDFRFAIDVVPEPQMHVDLGDFRYLSAVRGKGDAVQGVSLLVSRSASAAYVQIRSVSPAGTAPPPPPAASTADTGAPSAGVADARPFVAGTLAGALENSGSAVLDDLTFASGSTDLGSGPYASLKELAAYLRAHPDKRVVLVGHTDTTGGLDVNTGLSKQRAQSVRQRLIDSYGIPAAQLDAEGVGYLAPRASNLTAAGREMNRRVTAVLLPSG